MSDDALPLHATTCVCPGCPIEDSKRHLPAMTIRQMFDVSDEVERTLAHTRAVLWASGRINDIVSSSRRMRDQPAATAVLGAVDALDDFVDAEMKLYIEVGDHLATAVALRDALLSGKLLDPDAARKFNEQHCREFVEKTMPGIYAAKRKLMECLALCEADAA